MATAVISHANSFLKLKFFICGFLVDCLIKKSPGSRSYGMQPGTFVTEAGLEPARSNLITGSFHVATEPCVRLPYPAHTISLCTFIPPLCYLRERTPLC
jgi:hypothetical protein